MKFRRFNRSLHRDLGYFFFGTTLIYALSGIALNHRHEWNPNYVITREEFRLREPVDRERISRENAESLLHELGLKERYRTHLVSGDTYRIFVENGSVTLDIVKAQGHYELIRKRPVFFQVNFLHYNTPGKLWTWFSDFYAVALILLAVSGLFILKGKEGITRRGAWLTGLGLLIPLVFLYFYL